MQAVKNHDNAFVYTAQTNKSKQIDRYVETVNTRSLFDSKKQVTVGIIHYSTKKCALIIFESMRITEFYLTIHLIEINKIIHQIV